MAGTGAARFTSAWAYKKKGGGNLSLLRNEVMAPAREEEIWVDWWFQAATAPPATGNSNFFFFFDGAFACLAIIIVGLAFWII